MLHIFFINKKNVNKGIFIIGKLYCIINDKDEFIKRAKGLDVKSIIFNG